MSYIFYIIITMREITDITITDITIENRRMYYVLVRMYVSDAAVTRRVSKKDPLSQ